jgi:hypothetical protein
MYKHMAGANPIATFIREKCVRGPYQITLQAMMRAYQIYHPTADVNQRNFAGILLEGCPDPKPSYKRTASGMSFIGIGLQGADAMIRPTKTDEERKLAKAATKRRYYEKKCLEKGRIPGPPRGSNIVTVPKPELEIPEDTPMPETMTKPVLPNEGPITRDQYTAMGHYFNWVESKVTDPEQSMRLEDDHVAQLRALQKRVAE